MATEKEKKDKTTALRFGQETASLLDKIKKMFIDLGDPKNDSEVVRTLIHEGASKVESHISLGIHNDLESLKKSSRMGLLYAQTRMRAGEPWTRAELVFLAQFWTTAYSYQGVRNREWVSKSPVACLYQMLFFITKLQAESSGLPLAEQDLKYFERWGQGGGLNLDNTKKAGWVSTPLARHICQLILEKLEGNQAVDIHRLESMLYPTVRESILRTALYGYWAKNEKTVLDNNTSDDLSPATVAPGIFAEFRFDPIVIGHRFTCGVAKENQWIVGVNSWVEWSELNELMGQIAEGSLSASAGRFTLFAPMSTNFYLLDISSVRLSFQRSEFANFQEALRRTNASPEMLALREKFLDTYGEI